MIKSHRHRNVKKKATSCHFKKGDKIPHYQTSKKKDLHSPSLAWNPFLLLKEEMGRLAYRRGNRVASRARWHTAWWVRWGTLGSASLCSLWRALHEDRDTRKQACPAIDRTNAAWEPIHMDCEVSLHKIPGLTHFILSYMLLSLPIILHFFYSLFSCESTSLIHVQYIYCTVHWSHGFSSTKKEMCLNG